MDVNVAFDELMKNYDEIVSLIEICPELVKLGIVSDFDYKTLTTIKGRLDRKYAKTKGDVIPVEEAFTYRSTRKS